MLKGCSFALLAWAVCGGAYWYLIHERFAPPLDVAVPAGAGLLMAIALGTFRQGLVSAASAARAAQQATFTGMSGERPRDGEVVTAVGHISALGSALRSPISDRPAVIYSYDISHVRKSDGLHRWISKDYSGFALAPTMVESRYGALRLFSFPTLEGFRVENPPEAVTKAREYVAGASFADMTNRDTMETFKAVRDRFTDDSGEIRRDYRSADDPQVHDDAMLLEDVVAPGEQVTVIGRYSAEKNGLVRDAANDLRLLRGGALMTSAALWKKAAGAIIASLIFAAIVNGVLFSVVKSMSGKISIPRTQKQIRQNAQALHTASRDRDLVALQNVVAAGTSVDARDDEGDTALMRAGDAKTAAWLIAHGADVNATNQDGDTALMEQSRHGSTDVVSLLVQKGAKLDVVSPKWKTTALQQALDAEHLDVAQILRHAGARDDTVTAKNGRPLKERSDAVRAVMAYLDGIQHQDLAAMNAVSDHVIKDVDLKVWKEAYPSVARLVSGFANDQAATISVRGKVKGDNYATWTFQLVHPADGWKVARARWETRFDSRSP